MSSAPPESVIDSRRRKSAHLIASFVSERSQKKKRDSSKVAAGAASDAVGPRASSRLTARSPAPRDSTRPPPISVADQPAPLPPHRDARPTSNNPRAMSPLPSPTKSPMGASLAAQQGGGGDDFVATARRRKSALLIQEAWGKSKRTEKGGGGKGAKAAGEEAPPPAEAKQQKLTKKDAAGEGGAEIFAKAGPTRPRSFLKEEWRPKGKKGSNKDGPTQIIRNLYVGNKEDAQNLPLLKKLGIKFIVNCTPNLPNYHEGTFAYYQIPVKDSEQASLSEYFAPASAQILHHLQSRQVPVLLHCIAGCSRSVSVCAAALISPDADVRLSLLFALKHIKALRPIAKPNASFLLQLCLLEAELNKGGSTVLKARGQLFEDYPFRRFVQDSRIEGRFELETEDEKGNSVCVII